MAATRGWLDPQGCPHIHVTIFPEGRVASVRRAEALIDTGFTGFALMPLGAASSFGLAPIGEMGLTGPDGRTEPTPVAWASIRLGRGTRQGLVFLAQGLTDILIGVHFLELFRKTLILSVVGDRVELTD